MFIADYLRDDGCALRIFAVISGPDPTASLQTNVFDVQDHDYADYIDMLAYGKHMFRLQTSEETTRSTWGEMGFASGQTYPILLFGEIGVYVSFPSGN